MGIKNIAKKAMMLVENGDQLLTALKQKRKTVKVRIHSNIAIVDVVDEDKKTREYVQGHPFGFGRGHFKVVDPSTTRLAPSKLSKNFALWTLTDQDGSLFDCEPLKMVLLPSSVTIPKITNVFVAEKEGKWRLVVEQTKADASITSWFSQMEELKRELTLSEWKSIVAQIFYATHKLHQAKVSHNDLHLGNIMVKKTIIDDEGFTEEDEESIRRMYSRFTQFEPMDIDSTDGYSFDRCERNVEANLRVNVGDTFWNIPLINNTHLVLIDYDLSAVYDSEHGTIDPNLAWAPFEEFTPSFDILRILASMKTLCKDFPTVMNTAKFWVGGFNHWIQQQFGTEDLFETWDKWLLPSIPECEEVHISAKSIFKQFFVEYYEPPKFKSNCTLPTHISINLL